MRSIIVLIFFDLFLSNAVCYGNLQKELDNFFNSFGSSANVNSTDIYEGQKAGYCTGGGLSIRNRVIKTHPATINLPKFDAGCGGIDIYAGGFSFINDQQLINQLKNIGSNAIGYAFLLGMETVSPQITNTIKQLQSWANAINNISINSCEVASTLVGAVWPRQTMASEHICRTTGIGLFGSSDYIKARHDCSSTESRETTNKKAQDSNILTDQFNIAWEAIRQDPELAKDNELSQHFMTLMGTFILSKEDGDPKGVRYPSKITDEGYLNALINGGNIVIYKCKETKQCLAISETTTHVPNEKSWLGRTRQILIDIQDKIFKDEELIQNEIDFLSKSRLPLYKIVNVMSAYKNGYCPLDLYQIADIVAMDMLLQYLKESIDKVREGCSRLRLTQMYATEIDEYLNELKRIEETVRYYETRTLHVMEKEFQILQKIQLIEEQLSSEIILY